MTGTISTAAGFPLPRRRCAGYVEDDTEPSGRRRCPLDLDPALLAAGMTTHPGCAPGEKWCEGCRQGEAGCGCREPRWARPSAQLTPRPPPAVRAAALRRRGYRLCAPPGARLTHEDLDAVEEFGDLLASRRAGSR